jgi:hypothetical protein
LKGAAKINWGTKKMNIRRFVPLGLVALMGAISCLSNSLYAAPFTNGNLAIYRAGSAGLPAVALAATGNPAFVDEYTTAGVFVQTIALPTVTSGSNFRLVTTGTATSEGFLTRSANSNCLVLSGYDAAIPTAALSGTTAAANNRVIGVIDPLGAVDTTTALNDHASTNNPRSVASDNCTNLWVAGGSGGVRFATKGTVGASASLAPPTFQNVRQVNIFNGQLYTSAAAGTARLATVGTGLPTTGVQPITALPGFPATASAIAFFFADLDPATPGLDTLYVADEGGGLLKYSLVAGTWTANGVVGVASDLYRGLTGVVSGTTVTLYATRKGGNVTANLGELVRVVDATGYNATITAAPTVLVTAAANTTFHGVAFVPVPLFTVTPTAGANGSIAPNTAQSVLSGNTTTFTITANAGFNASVATGAGACGGTLTGTTPNFSYTTAAVTSNCSVSVTFVAILAQTITGFTPVSPVVLGAAPATLTATGGGSGNPIVFATTSAATVCTVVGSTVTFVGVGTCNLTANQAGNVNYFAAPQVTASIVINPVSQTITFGANPGPVIYSPSGTFAVSATASSTLPVAFTSASPGVCSVAGSTVTIITAGSCIINANQAGNGTFAAAPQVQQTIVINQATQAITALAPATPVTLGTAPATLTATGGASANPVTFATTSAATICTVVGTTITYVGVGTCAVTANQAGNTNYAAAPQIIANVVINAATQTITFGANPGPVTYSPSGTVAVSAAASSTLPVTFTSGSPGVCSVAGSTVTIITAGSCLINANQAGNGTFAAAPQVQQTIAITQATQAITAFAPATPVTLGAAPATLSATGGASGNPVTFATTSAATICTVVGTTITYVGVGTCAVTANQTGNTNYTTAPQVIANVVINAALQTITFGTNPGPVVYAPGGTFAVSASASSGLSVTYSSASPGVCSVAGAAVTIITAGGCLINADQTGNGTFSAAPQVQQAITITAASQAITGFAPASPVTLGTIPATLTATGGASGNAVAFSTTSPASVCTVVGTTVTYVGVGTCAVTANQAGNANYGAAASVVANIAINAASQTITFGANPGPVVYAPGGTFAVSATASSGLPVTYSSASLGVCSVVGSTVTIFSAGSCVINADQAGNGTFNPATTVQQTIIINPAAQTITAFAPASPVVFGAAPVTLNAIGGASGNPVVFATSSAATICTVAGATVTFVGAGTCNLTANQAGNANYAAAAQATAAIVINAATQAITFGALTNRVFGTAPFTVAATGGASGNPVTFASTTLATCTVVGATVTLVSAGTCTVRASQAGNTNYSAATDVDQSFTITQAAQAITGFAPASPVVFGTAPATLTASGGASGNPIVFATTSAATICTVTGATVTYVGVGTCNVTANQAGNTNYSAAPTVAAAIVINPATQTIIFAPLANRVFGVAPFTVAATGGASGNPVTFASFTPATCTVAGTTVTIVSAGACTIRASQTGNANYSAATDVDQTFTITQAAQAITGFAPASPVVFGAAPATLTATGGASGVPVVFTTTSPATVCTVVGNVVTYVGVGTCNVTANQAGNTNYAAAPILTAAIVINQAPQAITGFAPTTPVSFGVAPVVLNATGGASGVPIVYATTSAATVCTVAGNTVTLVGVGTCNLTANQAGNANYAAAPQVTAAIVINAAVQTITFGTLVDRVFGVAPITVAAVGGASGNPVTFTSLTPAVCTSAGLNGSTVTLLGVGTCTVRAAQAGNANFGAATNVDQSFAVTQGVQTISGFTPPTSIAFAPNGTFVLAATSTNSANPIIYTSTTPAVCTIVGNIVTILSAGSCGITASQPATANFAAAALVSVVVAVVPAAQTIAFGAIAGVNAGAAPVPLSANASSGLPVTFISLTPTVCTVTGTTATIVGTGVCSVQASQTGNGNYQAAPNVTQSFNVGGALRLDTSATLASYAEIITLTAYVSGNNVTGNITFSIDNGNKPGVIPACGNVPVVGGVAICLVPSSYQTANPLGYTARFSGDANNVAASVTNVQSILLDNAVLTLSNDLVSPVVVGTQTTVTALIRMRQPVGTVTFYERVVPADAPASVFTDVPLKDCINLPMVLLSDSTDAATASCPITARGSPRPPIVALYSYPAAHISGRTSETRILQYTTRDIRAGDKGPADYSDMWWAGQVENGWGVSITQHGAIQFNVIYAYDENRNALWYAMPGGNWDSAGTTFSGALYRPNGARFDQYDVSQFRVNESVGTASITYTSANTATLEYTINGVKGKKSIIRQIYAQPDGQRRLPINDLWWAGQVENGWGLNISQQGSQLFPIWYTYNSGGNTTFYPLPGGKWNSLVFAGDMYATISSPWLGVNYDPNLFIARRVGQTNIDFANANDATITYEVNGVVQTKRIQRQPY